MGATVAGLGGVVERTRRKVREERGLLGPTNCRDAKVSREGNWVARFILEAVGGA